MKSASIDVFFSCSFADDDRDVNDYFYAICKAMDIRCVNVGTAYSVTPPEKAKLLINDSQGLIVIATKRTKIDDKKYNMPSAVHDEISIAFGLDTPLLMFVEDGVVLDGFIHNYGTHLRFDKDKLYTSEFIEKAIAGVHGFKMDILSPHELIVDQDTNEFYAEYQHQLFELKEDSCCDYTWEYSINKKLIFKKLYKRAFKTGVWATVKSTIADNAKLVDWDIKVEGGSKDFKINVIKEKHTADCFEALLKIEPHPEPDDFIEYSITSSSKYFNPIWEEDINEPNLLTINDNHYSCFDGVIPIVRTKKSITEFRFPRSYGLDKKDIVPFVGSYTSNIDYLVDSELERANIQVDSIAGNITVRIDVNSPLLRHEYGVAWNPKKRPNK